MSLVGNLYKIYLKSPDILKKIVGYAYDYIPDKYKYGRSFFDTYNTVKKFEFASKEEIDEFQNMKVIDIVNYAYNNIEFYRKKYDEYGVDINSIKGVKDLKKLPLISKEEVIENMEDMIPRSLNKNKLRYITTGGTSGKPMGIYTSYDNEIIEWANVVAFWSRIGYKKESCRAVFRGKRLSCVEQGRYWIYDSIKKELSISTFHMNDENMMDFFNQINRYKPEFFHGYMSAIVTFTNFMKKNNLKLDYKLKAILATSENIYKHQVEFVEEYYNTRVFSFYGHTERLIFAGECEGSRQYHVNPTYGFAEIVNEKGEVVDNGEIGELVGTGFINKIMPLIRYKTGDIAKLSRNQKCDSCGRNHQIIENVEGRWKQEMLVKKDGTLFSMTSLNIHSEIYSEIEKFQLYQDTPGEIVLKVVPKAGTTQDKINILIEEMLGKVGEGVNIYPEVVNSIDNKKNGKFMFVEQKLDVLNISNL